MNCRILSLIIGLLGLALTSIGAPSLMEALNRGVIALRTGNTEVYVSWRLLGTDAPSSAFNVYRATGGAAAVKLNPTPLAGGTNFVDTTADLTQANAYSVRAVVDGNEIADAHAHTLVADSQVQPYLRLPLQVPGGGTTPDGVTYTYQANDCSVGDLDGDGTYEIIVKWDPSNAKDNAHSGHTGNVLLDAYRLDGTLLWRIDLGVNIRAGAHYTQFMVYDLDGDGRAEIACRTAEGSRDATGAFVAATFSGELPAIDHAADRRNTSGFILVGPEFLTIFDGLTGAEKVSTNYNPPRHPSTRFPTPDQINALWGDNWGNRMDRFLASVAYLDGQRPSLVMCRGYYTRSVLVAYDYRDGVLTQRWIFDTHPNGGAAGPYGNYAGQGNHGLSVADVDGDGRDEIIYGSCTIDDDGRGLYSTQLGHGDALHVTDIDPARPGLEIWAALENGASTGIGHTLRDARTGQILFSVPSNNDAGRAMVGDIDPAHPGFELWGARGSLYDARGNVIGTVKPSMNFGVWWDGDLQRELLDGIVISKWNPAIPSAVTVLEATGCASNNGTKATPALSADLLGDWREEVIWRENDSAALRIYSSTTPNSHRLFTLMHDRQYRLAIAWQNVGYNQPPYPSFYIGEGMATPSQPDIVTRLDELPAVAPAVVAIQRYAPAAATVAATSLTFRVVFNTPVTGVGPTDFLLTTTNTATGTVAAVSGDNGLIFDVTVNSITGLGTIRLDLVATGTGIVDAVGVPISGGFTTGEAYARATFAWVNPLGGAWSNPANWDDGGIADGDNVVANFGAIDTSGSVAVAVDSPRLLSGMNFGDTDAATASSWTINHGGIETNTLTLDVASGSPTITVANTTATILASLAGNDGLTKAGAGTLELTGASPLTGAITVSGGTLRLGSGGSLAIGNRTVNTSSGTRLEVAGGSFSAGGLVTVRTSTFALSAGEVAFNGGFRTDSEFSGTLLMTGGTLTSTDVTIRRNSAGTPDYNSGFIVRGGTAEVGTVFLGTNGSYGAMSVEGGMVTATKAITIGNVASNSSRGGALRVIGGTFNSTDTALGLVLVRSNANISYATFSGGVTTAEKVTFGATAAVAAGRGDFTLSGGSFYLGSGGMVKNGTGAFAANIVLSGGLLGAKAAWATDLPVAITGTALQIAAADADAVGHDITLTGALTGDGSFTKTGAGTLTLAGTSTNTGSLTVAEGTLNLTGTLATGGELLVGPGAALTGNGVIGKPVTLTSGSILAPTGTFTGTDATWNPGAVLALDIGPGGDLAVLSGNLTKGTAGVGPYVVNVLPRDGFEVLTPYTLATFASTDFTATDFVAAGLPAGSRGACVVNPTSIQIVYFGYGADAAFNEWLFASGVPSGQRGATDDPDADGIPNLLEFVFGTSPLASTPLNVVPITVEEAGETYPAIQFNRRRDLGGVAIEIRADTEPGCAANHGVLELSIADRGDGIDAVVVRSNVPLSAQPRQFMRVFASFPSADPM